MDCSQYFLKPFLKPFLTSCRRLKPCGDPTPPSCQDCQDKFNPQERLTLLGSCLNCKGPDDQLTKQTWKLLDENGNEDLHLSGNNSVTDSLLGWNSINLVLKDRVLKEGTTYFAQLTGTRGNRQSTVRFLIRTRSPPHSGSCRVL